MKSKLLTTMIDYSWRTFGDELAGITVALVALPLSIAIAVASGADPKAGLVMGIVAGFLIPLLGGIGTARDVGRSNFDRLPTIGYHATCSGSCRREHARNA